MRYFVMACALVGAGCSLTIHGTAFKSSRIEAQTVESKVTTPVATLSVSDPPQAYPSGRVEARNESGQIVIGGVCYAQSPVNINGKRTTVLVPVVCQ